MTTEIFDNRIIIWFIWCIGYWFSHGYIKPEGIYSLWLMISWPYELGKHFSKIFKGK